MGQPTWPKLAEIYRSKNWWPFDKTGTTCEGWYNYPPARGRQAANIFVWLHVPYVRNILERDGSVLGRRARVIRNLTKRLHEQRILAVGAEEASSAP